jgi:hypothetical protein
MAHLFDPLTIRDLTLANRVVVSPMREYFARRFSRHNELITIRKTELVYLKTQRWYTLMPCLRSKG